MDYRPSPPACQKTPEERPQPVSSAAEAYSALLKKIDDPAFIHDRSYRLVYANPAYLKWAERPLEEVRGRPYWEVFPRGEGPLPQCETGVREGTRDPTLHDYIDLPCGEVLLSRSYPMGELGLHIMVPTNRGSDAPIGLLRHALGERSKELQGLYAVASLSADPETDEAMLLQRVAEALPAAWQYPEITSVRVRHQGRNYVSPGFAESEWVQSAPLGSDGRIEVFYTEERRDADEGPFLKEERTLIEAVAAQLRLALSGRQTRSVLARTDESLRHRLRLEKLIAEVSGLFLDAGPERLDWAIDEALRRMGQFVDVDRSYLFQFEGDAMSNTHEWCRPGILSQKDLLQGVSPETMQWWMEQLRLDREINTQVANLPPEAAAERQILQGQDIQSILVVPLWKSGELNGFVGFDWVGLSAEPSEDDVRLLRVGAEVLGGTLERHNFERRLQRANRALRVKSVCSDAIIHSTDEQTLLETVCWYLVEQGGYTTAWVGIADPDQAIRVIACGGDTGGDLEQLSMSWGSEANGQGPCGRAIATGKPQVCRNLADHGCSDPWRSRALAAGYRSTVALPLNVRRERFGVLTIHSSESDNFDNREVSLLVDLAADIGFGIGALRNHWKRARAERALQESEERFELAVSGASDGIWDWKIESADFYWSERLYELLGYAPGELQASFRVFEEQLLHPDDREALHGALHDHLERNVPFSIEQRLRRKNGSFGWFLVRGRAVRDESGRPVRMAGAVTDITERKQTEVRLKRLNRTYAVVSACNQAVVQAEDETLLLDTFCRNLVEVGGYGLAWVGYLSPDDSESLDRVASAVGAKRNIPLSGPLPPVRVALAESPEGWVLQQGEARTIHDIQRTELFEPWGRAADVYGFRAMTALPLMERKQTIGALSIYTEDADALDDEEMRLLKDMAADLSFGIHALRSRAARNDAEAMLQLSNRAIEAARNGIMMIDATRADFPLIYVNPAFEAITGYCGSEVLGRNPAFLQGTDTEQSGLREIGTAIRNESSGSAVLRNYRKDGSRFWNELYIAPVRDESGRLTHFVGIINDVTERQRYQEQLEFQAQHDELTGLPNRNLLRDRIEQALNYAERHGRNLAVLFIDLDRFKFVNDSLGHPAGDELLRHIGQRLTGFARRGDTVSRYGGDEFVIVLSDVAREEDVDVIARRVLARIGEPVVIGEREFVISASIGISVYPRDGRDADALLQHADTAMYRAKEVGRSNVQFYTAELNARMLERLTLQSRLQKAIENEELRVHYQPQARLRDGRVSGLEALVRWQHPELGLLPPGRFVPLAEETGLIIPLGEWVLRTACKQNRRWQDDKVADLPIAVNLSVRQLERDDFPDLIASILKDTGLEPHFLELEVTESALMTDPQGMVERLSRIKALGCKLSLDDFGTGYSSLSYLKRFPFDRLKIDRTFVSDITVEPQDAAIAKTIIAMARTLGLEVLAEGVETEAQFNYLQKNGCDLAQGFLLSHPESAEDIEYALRSGRAKGTPTALPRSEQPALLVIDDEPNMTRALKRLLRRDGYRVLTINDPREAFDLLAMNDVHVILSDQRMPEMTGTELLSRIKDLYPDVVRIILSGYTELKTITEAVNKGWIYKFVTKPWDDDELRAQIREAFERYQRNRSERQVGGGVS